MLSVQRMTPFYTSQEDFQLRLVFAYQYFSILKGGDVFQFIPSEGKEIVINTKSLQVENLGEVFVFQRGNRFIRLPLYQLLLISDLHIHLTTILEGTMGLEMEVETLEVVTLEAVGIIEQLEADNRLRMIDYALETDNIQMFNELTEGLQQN
ncbi:MULTISPECIES: transcriptional regulator [Sporosarcina]|uniref:Transcriptional regulator n=1 Tax=Sporosarcina psychrophila TaxID=1476 RepID=A0ABV2K2Q9_SPOPS|nr:MULTISPECIES: transcriptional regulator [Sporosarcina]AMQ07918.1 transcriptional regulator [Sporosarcina psychrophila]QNK87625.1 transcriptional regulator [Sporosarcina sp. resist]